MTLHMRGVVSAMLILTGLGLRGQAPSEDIYMAVIEALKADSNRLPSDFALRDQALRFAGRRPAAGFDSSQFHPGRNSAVVTVAKRLSRPTCVRAQCADVARTVVTFTKPRVVEQKIEVGVTVLHYGRQRGAWVLHGYLVTLDKRTGHVLGVQLTDTWVP